jgi:hypothetical protein
MSIFRANQVLSLPLYHISRNVASTFKRLATTTTLLSVKTHRRVVTGNTRSREASGIAGGPWSLDQRPSNLAHTLAWSH